MNTPSAAGHYLACRLLAGSAAALFDLDNTLIETHIDFPAMKCRALEFAESRGIAARDIESLDVLAGIEFAAGRLGADADTYRREAWDMLQQIELQQCGAPVELPGAADLLCWLRDRGVRVAVVTRNCRLVSERLLEAGRLSCDLMLAREDVPHVKPHPGHLLTAVQRFGIPAANSVMVGDHYMDVQAGRAAAMKTIGLLRGRAAAFYSPAIPTALAEDIAEIWSAIRSTTKVSG